MSDRKVCDRGNHLVKQGEATGKLTLEWKAEATETDAMVHIRVDRWDICEACIPMVTKNILDRVLLKVLEEVYVPEDPEVIDLMK